MREVLVMLSVILFYIVRSMFVGSYGGLDFVVFVIKFMVLKFFVVGGFSKLKEFILRNGKG